MGSRYFVLNEKGDVQGVGYTPDGTFPIGAVPCSEYEAETWEGRSVRDGVISDQKTTPIEAAKEQAILSIEALHADFLQRQADNPTTQEVGTWDLKLSIATAIANSEPLSAAQSAFISGAGLATSEARAGWASAVLQKAAYRARMVGVADSIRATAKAAVKAAVDATAIEAALASAKAAFSEASS